jgi:Fic family protein
MEPMMPRLTPELAELTMEIARHAGELESHLPSEITRDSIRDLVAEMNSYYSNLIEGHKTYPLQIQEALRKNFSENKKEHNNQLLSLVHIEVEREMIRRLREQPDLNVHCSQFLRWLHERFYQQLPEELHYSESRSGEKYKINPGELRPFFVDVGAHLPPHFEALPQFLFRFESFYSSNIQATDRLVAIAAALTLSATAMAASPGCIRKLR